MVPTVTGKAYLLIPVLTLACAGKVLRPGDSDILRQSDGKEIGSVRQVNVTEREYFYDSNQDQKPEFQWKTKSGAMVVFEKFNTHTGKMSSRSYYVNGKLNYVEVYFPDGSMRGIVSYPDGQTARSVELPRRKRLVEFVSR